jgi:hypothetical protein
MDKQTNDLQFAGKIIPNYLMSTEDTEANVFETSYVSAPATDRGFLMFSRDESAINQFAPKNQNFSILKEEDFKILDKSKVDATEFQRMTSGVWMLPNTKYIRQTEEGELYTVEFTPETLKAALLKYLKSGYANMIKSEHSGEYLDGFVAMEHWIIEDENTLSPIFKLSLSDLGYKPSDIPAGTVMKTTFVADEQFWNEKVLTGMVKGYSIGGLFNLVPLDSKQQSFKKEGFPEVKEEVEQKSEEVKTEEFQTVEVKVEIEIHDEENNEDVVEIESEIMPQEAPEEEMNNVNSRTILDESTNNEAFSQTKNIENKLMDFANMIEQFKSQIDDLKTQLSNKDSEVQEANKVKEELKKKVLDQPIKSNFNTNQTNNKPANQEGFVTLNGKRIKIPK